MWRIEDGVDFVQTVALAPTDATVALGTRESMVHILDMRDGSTLRSLDQQDSITHLTFSEDGRELLSGSYDGRIRHWNVERGEALATLEGHAGHVMSSAFAQQPGVAYSIGNDGWIIEWDLATGRERSRHAHDARGDTDGAVAWTADRAYAAINHRSAGQVVLHDVANQRTMARLGPTLAWGPTISPDGTTILSASLIDGTVGFWNLDSILMRGDVFSGAREGDGAPPGDATIEGPSVVELAESMHPGTAQDRAALLRAPVRTFGEARHSHDPRERASFALAVDRTQARAFVGTGMLSSAGVRYIGSYGATRPNRFIAGLEPSAVTILSYDLANDSRRGEPMEVNAVHRDAIIELALDTRRREILVGSVDRGLALWGTSDGSLRWSYGRGFGPMRAVQFFHDGRRVGFADNTLLKTADRTTGVFLDWGEGHGANIQAIAESPSRGHVYSGDEDGVINVWRSDSLVVVDQFSLDGPAVLDLAVGPDEQRLFSTSSDGRGPGLGPRARHAGARARRALVTRQRHRRRAARPTRSHGLRRPRRPCVGRGHWRNPSDPHRQPTRGHGCGLRRGRHPRRRGRLGQRGARVGRGGPRSTLSGGRPHDPHLHQL